MIKIKEFCTDSCPPYYDVNDILEKLTDLINEEIADYKIINISNIDIIKMCDSQYCYAEAKVVYRD